MKTKKIYVVIGSTGEYSDRMEWLVKAFTSEKKAMKHVTKASEAARKIELNRKSPYHAPENLNIYDPQMLMDYTGTNYHYEEVILESKK